MTSTLLGRIDRGASFITLFLGASVFADVPHWLQYAIATGLCATTVYVIVFQPGACALKAAAQQSAYEDLNAKSGALPDDELSREFAAIQKQDSSVLGALHNAAHVGECIRLDREPNITLSWRERVIAWLAGDLPRAPTP